VAAPAFDADKFKATTREQWQEAAAAWDRWGPTLEDWLGPATEAMPDDAGVRPGARVLDVAAGAGGQTWPRRAAWGPTGMCWPPTSRPPSLSALPPPPARPAWPT
jgi:hypothetical protein